MPTTKATGVTTKRSSRGTTKPSKPPTSAEARNPGRRISTRLNPETIDESPGEVFDDQDDADSESLAESESDNNAAEQAPKKSTGKKAAVAQPAPSVPSELATTQGRTAFDIRFFFNIPDKTCYRCM